MADDLTKLREPLDGRELLAIRARTMRARDGQHQSLALTEADREALLRAVDRLRAERDELKGRMDAADEAFIDMAQTRGGLDRADALMHVTRIMSTLRGHETPHRVAYERVRNEAGGELERLRKGMDDAAWHLNEQRQRADWIEAKRDELKALATEVLGHFTHQGHPGEPCRRTGWIRDRQIAAWLAALDTPTEET